MVHDSAVTAPAARIAVIGDVHLCFDARDVRALDAAGLDLVLFVGDFANYRVPGGLEVARYVATLRTPALVLPGNHDGVTGAQLGAEVFGAPDALRDALGAGMERRVDELRRALAPVPLVGYGVHRFEALGLTVVSARPHSGGGPRPFYRRYLARRFGVGSMEESAAKLRALFDEVGADERVVVLAHTGPTGLGSARDAIYGADFRPEAGDFGDPDLAAALDHARATGKRVLAVVAGHMHHRLRGGGFRTTSAMKDGVTHVNAARVRRHRTRDGVVEAHHVRVTIGGRRSGDPEVAIEETWLPLG